MNKLKMVLRTLVSAFIFSSLVPQSVSSESRLFVKIGCYKHGRGSSRRVVQSQQKLLECYNKALGKGRKYFGVWNNGMCNMRAAMLLNKGIRVSCDGARNIGSYVTLYKIGLSKPVTTRATRRATTTQSTTIRTIRKSILADMVYVSHELGSRISACGSLTTPCKQLKLAVDKCHHGGKIILLGDQILTSEIVVTKDLSILGYDGATIKGNTTSGVVFHITEPVTFHLVNLKFDEIGIISVRRKSVVRIEKCSVKHSPKFLTITNSSELYRRTDEGHLIPTLNNVKGYALEITSTARGTILNVTSSRFQGWQNGHVINVKDFPDNTPSTYITFDGCIFSNTLGLYLSGVNGVSTIVRNSIFHNMTCTTIHFVSNDGSSTMSIVNSTFTANKGCTQIREGWQTASYGGAIRAEGIRSLHISDSKFTRCSTGAPQVMKGEISLGGNGGGLCIQRVSKVFIQGSIFDGNIAYGRGGNIDIVGAGVVSIKDCIFTSGKAIQGNGGSIYSTTSPITTIANCTFTENNAGESGGAIFLKHESFASSTSTIFINSNFTHNRAQEHGGAIMVDTFGILGVHSCLFNGNSGSLGGGIMVYMRGAYHQGIQATINDSDFKENKAKMMGGGVYAVRDKVSQCTTTFKDSSYSFAIQKCRFSNNSAMSSGQSVYSNDQVSMKDITIVTHERNIAPHIRLSDGDINVSNLSVQLHRDPQYPLPSKSEGIFITSDDIKLTRGLSFTCPTNFFVDDIKNASKVVSSQQGRWLGAKAKKSTTYQMFGVGCSACPYATYTLQSGQMHLPELSAKVPPENEVTIQNAKCFQCPTGAICDTAVKALDNFWGYVNEASELSFQLCPGGFCCGADTVPCTSYNTCAPGRKGALCGTCSEGFKQNFVGGDCIPKGYACNRTVFIVYIIGYIIMYSAMFIIITNAKDIMCLVKRVILKRELEIRQRDGESKDDKLPLAGFVQITILYFQVAGFLQVKFQDARQNQASNSSGELRKTITDFFNFRFTLYQKLCPSDELNLPQKEMILLGMKLGTFVFLFLLIIIYQVIKSMICCSRSSADGNATTSGEIETLSGVEDVIPAIEREELGPEFTPLCFTSMLKCTFIKLLKLYYTPFTKSVLMLVHCANILGVSRLYVYGDHVCYSGWQIGILLIVLPGILMFPICFELALRLLKDKLISSWQFVFATMIPYYAILLYIWNRVRKHKTTDVPILQGSDEESFRRIVLEGEELLFKGTQGCSIGWQVVQFYRTFSISLISTFLTNPIYRQLSYGALLLFFVVHDGYREPYKHQYLNILQSLTSRCLVLVLFCNFIPAVSYMANVRTVPYIYEVMEVLGLVELIIYAVVPLSLPVWKLRSMIEIRMKEKKEE